ncbi:MAG: ribonuclease P protein subunit [Halobacteria archaeon]|nr:ribonuclease P protein subunit [Halobacteria archaeon]
MTTSSTPSREPDIEPDELVRHELIGLDVRVVDSTDETLVGVEGRVVGETKSTLELDLGVESSKQVQKSNSTFEFELADAVVQVEGDVIEERPADRIKMKIR